MIHLAKALKVKLDYFFRPIATEISNIEFRKRCSLGVKKINAIKQRVAENVERYIEIENSLQIKAYVGHQFKFSNPIKNEIIHSFVDIYNVVNQLLSA